MWIKMRMEFARNILEIFVNFTLIVVKIQFII